jgi:cation diffusion facilitator family transporter
MSRSESEQAVLPECYWCAENVGRLAFWGNLGLCVVKAACGMAGESKAVVADAVHSGVDVVMALVLMACLRVSKAPPNEKYPYGHGNVEYVASLFVAICLSLLTGFIIYDAVADMAAGTVHQPSVLALAGLLISLAGNQLMYRHSLCCGTRFRSPAMIANALENRADVYSTLGALAGVIGAQLGLLFMDSLGAIVVASLIGFSAARMFRDAWSGMLDHAADESVEEKILSRTRAVEGVEQVVSLRTRSIGPQVGVELKVQVSPELSMRQCSDICERVRTELVEDVERLGLVTVTATGGGLDA